MLPFLVSRGWWPEACVLIGRGVNRSRWSHAVSGRAVADREGVRGAQWTHCWVHVAGIAGLLRRGSASWLCVLGLGGRGWGTPDRGVAGPASLAGAARSLATVALASRPAPRVPVWGAPVGCRGVADRGGVARDGQASRCCTARAVGVLPG